MVIFNATSKGLHSEPELHLVLIKSFRCCTSFHRCSLRDFEIKADASSYLFNNDSYNFFKGNDDTHLKIGHTGTNVMDVQILLFETAIDNGSASQL